MIYIVLFSKKPTSFYSWRPRYKPFHLSHTTSVMQKGIPEDMEFPRTVYDFYNSKTPFLKFWKINLPFLDFEKRNSLYQHSPALLPCHNKENRCLMPRLDEAKRLLGLYFAIVPHMKILKKQNSFYRIRWYPNLPW